MKGLSLARLRNTNFSDLYRKLALEQKLNQKEYEKILSLAIIFINESNQDLSRLGYRMIVFYCNQLKNYKPLYDVALNSGLIPIVKSIESIDEYKGNFKDSFFNNFYSAFSETYRKGNIYYSEQQKNLLSFFDEKENDSVSVIAPTSYGKSELIISSLKSRKVGNMCVIVPTKALVAQTKRRILESINNNETKIITHPEMFLSEDSNITAILTQERLLRLLRKEPDLDFDVVFIDEAHNLLEDDSRSVLLATAIAILEKRNPQVIFKFLTPFLMDSLNLKVKYSNYTPKTFKITEYIKTERLYIYDFRKEGILKLYDQFLDEYYVLEDENFHDDVDLILKKMGRKNIIYLNKPIDLEKFSYKLSLRIDDISSEKIQRACDHLSKYLDPQYFLIDCLKKGFIYHHGSVPDNVRLYIEHLFSEVEDIRFVITSSTLLEGVNIPSEKLFLLDNKKGRSNLSPSQFKNLIGRVCRFNEIFSPVSGDLKKLEPNIYLVGSDYFSKQANLEKYIKTCMKVDKEDKDNPENILLKTVEITDDNIKRKEAADDFLENFEPGVVPGYDRWYAKTKIGKLCFLNNITELDIIKHEDSMQQIINQGNIRSINSAREVFDAFANVFLPFIIDHEDYNNLRRLSYRESRNFYQMFLDWRIKSASYNEMIASFLNYWGNLEMKREDTIVYVGKWGDTTRNGFRPMFTDISQKKHEQRINLAIVRIKEEQDFLDNTIIKYIEVLNDLGLLENSFYEKIKYGTNNSVKISLIKNGLSLGLANLLVNNYRKYIMVDVDKNNIKINSSILEKMNENDENEIHIFELNYNTKLFN